MATEGKSSFLQQVTMQLKNIGWADWNVPVIFANGIQYIPITYDLVLVAASRRCLLGKSCFMRVLVVTMPSILFDASVL